MHTVRVTEETSASVGGAKTMTKHVAATVARLRAEQRMPLTELAARLAKLGTPIARLGLLRLERGERRVDVSEVAALAKALGVPPLLLMFPVGAEAETEIFPGEVRDTWAAAKWFIGEEPYSAEAQYDERGVRVGFTTSSADYNAWHVSGRALRMAREHERLLQRWQMVTMHALGDMAEAREAEGTPQYESLRRLADEELRESQELEKALLEHRRAMERAGFVVPFVKELEPAWRQRLSEHGLTPPTAATRAATLDELEDLP